MSILYYLKPQYFPPGVEDWKEFLRQRREERKRFKRILKTTTITKKILSVPDAYVIEQALRTEEDLAVAAMLMDGML